MREWEASLYGEKIAGVYDHWFKGVSDTDATVECLANLAGGGPVLELGIGTGRIGLPLAARGLEVHGIEISPAMVEELKDKPGNEKVSVTIGDFADVGVEGPFALIFVAANTFTGLATQDDQVRCFANAAARLQDDGVFVVDTWVSEMAASNQSSAMSTRFVRADDVGFRAEKRDPIKQTITTQDIVVSEQGIRLYPNLSRYVWPSELDLMARLAGLTLRSRWGGWAGQPFTGGSARHVAVYARSPSDELPRGPGGTAAPPPRAHP